MPRKLTSVSARSNGPARPTRRPPSDSDEDIGPSTAFVLSKEMLAKLKQKPKVVVDEDIDSDDPVFDARNAGQSDSGLSSGNDSLNEEEVDVGDDEDDFESEIEGLDDISQGEGEYGDFQMVAHNEDDEIGSFEEDYGSELDQDEDDEEISDADSSSDSDSPQPKSSLLDRLAQQLALLGPSTTGTTTTAGKVGAQLGSPQAVQQEKSVAIRKQLELYQQQLKLRLLLQHPQGILEQVPTTVDAFRLLTTIPMSADGVALSERTGTKSASSNAGIDMGFSELSVTQSLQQGASRIRKLSSIIATDDADLDTEADHDPCQFHLDHDANLSDVQAYFAHPFVKRAKLAQAVTAQALQDLVRLEHHMASHSGATEADSGQADTSSNISMSKLHSTAFNQLIDINPVLKGMTAKMTETFLSNSQSDTTSLNTAFGDIESYLQELYTNSLSRSDQIIDKWEKRTSSGLAAEFAKQNRSGSSLASLLIPISQQIRNTVGSERPRLVQRSRLRRFAVDSLCSPSSQRDRDGITGADASVHSLDRFDSNVYDDFDFATNLLKDLSTARFASNSKDTQEFGTLGSATLQEYQESIRKRLKTTAFLTHDGGEGLAKRKKQVVVGNVIPKLSNFMIPMPDIAWIRANALEFAANSSGDKSTDPQATAEQVLGTDGSDAVFLDMLFLHLFGQQQLRTSTHITSALKAKTVTASASTGSQSDDDDSTNMDNGSDSDDAVDSDDDNSESEGADDEFGDQSMSAWFS